MRLWLLRSWLNPLEEILTLSRKPKHLTFYFDRSHRTRRNWKSEYFHHGDGKHNDVIESNHDWGWRYRMSQADMPNNWDSRVLEISVARSGCKAAFQAEHDFWSISGSFIWRHLVKDKNKMRHRKLVSLPSEDKWRCQAEKLNNGRVAGKSNWWPLERQRGWASFRAVIDAWTVLRVSRGCRYVCVALCACPGSTAKTSSRLAIDCTCRSVSNLYVPARLSRGTVGGESFSLTPSLENYLQEKSVSSHIHDGMQRFSSGFQFDAERAISHCWWVRTFRFPKTDLDGIFCEASVGPVNVKDIHHKSDQWYLALVVLTSDESQGMMTRSGSGNGAEALRMLVERWWQQEVDACNNGLISQLIEVPVPRVFEEIAEVVRLVPQSSVQRIDEQIMEAHSTNYWRHRRRVQKLSHKSKFRTGSVNRSWTSPLHKLTCRRSPSFQPMNRVVVCGRKRLVIPTFGQLMSGKSWFW